MASLSQDDIKALEHTRQRLLTLHTSLASLQQNIFEQQPLPSWSSLQSHSALVSSNLQQLAQLLKEHENLLASTVVYPLPQFPGRTQEHILQQMLRTKLEPDVKDWVEQGQSIAKEAPGSSSYLLSEDDRTKLWAWAPPAASREGRKQKWGADYTLAEMQLGVENVETGLQRQLVEPADDEILDADEDEEDDDEDDEEEELDEEDEEEDEQDEKMNVVEVRRKSGTTGLEFGVSSRPTVSQMPLENIFRFMMTGSTDRGVS